MKSARFVVGVGAVCGFAGIAWLATQRVSSAEFREKKLEARIAALEGAEPKQTERVIEREIRVDLNAAAAASTSSARAEPQAPPNADNGSAPAIHSNEELADAYAASFIGEPVDPSWALDAERRLEPAVRRALPASSRLLSFDCRSKFCDIAVVHESIEASNGFIVDLFSIDRNGSLAHESGGFRAGAPTPTADGKLLYHLYVARPGSALALDPPETQAVVRNEKGN